MTLRSAVLAVLLFISGHCLAVQDPAPDAGTGRRATTAPAEISDMAVQRGDRMAFVVTLSCPDAKASITYRLGRTKQHFGPWKVYKGSFEVPADLRFIEVRTHRAGCLPSTTGCFLGGE